MLPQWVCKALVVVAAVVLLSRRGHIELLLHRCRCVSVSLSPLSSTKLFVCLGLARVLFIVVAGVFVMLVCVLAVSRRSDSVW